MYSPNKLKQNLNVFLRVFTQRSEIQANLSHSLPVSFANIKIRKTIPEIKSSSNKYENISVTATGLDGLNVRLARSVTLKTCSSIDKVFVLADI
jgi:hypothetical protein